MSGTEVPPALPRTILRRYVSFAPLPLAFERSVEARLLGRQRFERPVLDIGCGEGLFAAIAFAEPLDTGIDPNPRELARARELGSYVELIESCGDSIPKPDASYRTILSNSVLEHIPDLEPVLREAHRLLHPEGRFYITVPSELFERWTVGNVCLSGLRLNGWAARFRAFFNRFWRHHHVNTLAGWESLVRKCNFEVVEGHTYNPPLACLANDALAPLSLGGLLLKKWLNRWTLFPIGRRICLTPVILFGQWWLRGAESAPRGGLVFLSLRKH